MATEETTPSYMVPRPHVRAAAKQSHVQTGCASTVAARVSPVSDVASFPGAILAPTVCQYIHDLVDGKNFFDLYGADAMWMRALFAIGAIQIYFRGEKPSEAVSLINDLRGVLPGQPAPSNQKRSRRRHICAGAGGRSHTFAVELIK